MHYNQSSLKIITNRDIFVKLINVIDWTIVYLFLKNCISILIGKEHPGIGGI
jgi:hypothetical protein